MPGGRYPAAVDAAHDRRPGARRRRARDHRRLPAAGARRALRGASRPASRRVLPIGGAQAIAALAYGTESIARVDKIVGPGNAWVAAAKALVAADCAIDFHAGPSEIVVFADRRPCRLDRARICSRRPSTIRPRARSSSRRRRPLADGRARATSRAHADRQARRATRFARNGAIVVARTRSEAIELVNRLAPEHLVCDRAGDVRHFRAAGTIFVGGWSAQAAGDYCTGSNHVLPTGGAARFRGGLSAADFVRTFTVQTLTRRGIRAIGPAVVALADAEGLTTHAASVEARLR